METKSERERLYVKIDESGMLVEASYLPMVGSRITPLPVAESSAPRNASFEIDGQGVITGSSVHHLNGHKVMLYKPSSPAMGRTDTVTSACTWKPDEKDGWVCV